MSDLIQFRPFPNPLNGRLSTMSSSTPARYLTERCFPKADADLALSLDLIARNIAAEPAAHNVSRADAEELTRLAAAFHAALVRCWPGTRTSLDTAAKNQARDEALARFRPIIRQIRDDPAVTDALRINLNMRKPKRRSRGPYPWEQDPRASWGRPTEGTGGTGGTGGRARS